MTLDEFRKRFRVVDPNSLIAAEPTKYYDPWVERDDKEKG